MFQFPGFALNPYVFRAQSLHLTLESEPAAAREGVNSEYKRSKVGFPIRRSSDQSLFAAPQGLSQRTTSFIASQRQGIHRMLLRHLIALMIDVRSAEPTDDQKTCLRISPKTFACQHIRPTAAGRRWFVGTRCPPPNMLPLHDFKHPRRSPEGPANLDDAERCMEFGGARRDRTDDLKLAKLALSQLSYGPVKRYARPNWWAWDDSNVRPHPYQGCALTT